jgi:hypothetical protein
MKNLKMINHKVYPRLSNSQKEELSRIRPVIEHPNSEYSVSYYPCDVILKNGDLKRNVVVVEANEYFKNWQVWPDEDSGKQEVKLIDVASIKESENRLPEFIENKILNFWETGMGRTIFYLVLNDGTKMMVQCGGFKTLLDFNNKFEASDFVDAVPFDRFDRNNNIEIEPDLFGTNFFWCLFS